MNVESSPSSLLFFSVLPCNSRGLGDWPPYCRLCLVKSQRPLWSTRVPFPTPRPGGSFRSITWGHQRAHLICFPAFWEYFPSLSDVDCLKKLFHIFVHFFSCFKWEDQTSPCYSILALSGSPLCPLILLCFSFILYFLFHCPHCYIVKTTMK